MKQVKQWENSCEASTAAGKSLCFNYTVLEKKQRIKGILEPIIVFHENSDRCSEITELSYCSWQQDHIYINMKLLYIE